MTATETVPAVRVTDHGDGAVTLTAHQRYAITIAAEDRAPLAAAILPAPTTTPLFTTSAAPVEAGMFDSAFHGPAVEIRVGGLLAPDVAEQLAARLLAAAAEARALTADIEWAQDHSAPADRADLAAHTEGDAR